MSEKMQPDASLITFKQLGSAPLTTYVHLCAFIWVCLQPFFVDFKTQRTWNLKLTHSIKQMTVQRITVITDVPLLVSTNKSPSNHHFGGIMWFMVIWWNLFLEMIYFGRICDLWWWWFMFGGFLSSKHLFLEIRHPSYSDVTRQNVAYFRGKSPYFHGKSQVFEIF